MIKLFLYLMGIFLLSGCTSTYVAPVNGSVAYIKTSSTGTDYKGSTGLAGYSVMVGKFDENECIDGADEVKEESLDVDGYFAVSADKPIVLSVQRFTGNNMCLITNIMTTLESNSKYFMNYSLRGKGCYLTFYKINSHDSEAFEKADYKIIKDSYGICRNIDNQI